MGCNLVSGWQFQTQSEPMFVDPKLADELIECMRLAGLPE